MILASCSSDEPVQTTDSGTGVTTTAQKSALTSSFVITTSSTAITTLPVTTTMKEAENNTRQFTSKKGGIYNYCPSIMVCDDGSAYVYYCTNKDSNRIVDYVGFRKGTVLSNGEIKWGEESRVLSPTSGSWDAMHTCDPSVIKGKFNYNSEEYSYLLAYLGCTSIDNQDNKVGLAVAKSPEGPFVKIGDQPFIDFTMDPTVSVFQWGVGQPSLVSEDKEGKVYLFYTRGDKDGTRTIVENWDLSDLNSPKLINRETLSHKGLVNLNGGGDILNNADFAYDPESGRFYASSDCHPNPSDEPDFIASHFRIISFDPSEGFSDFTWRNDYQIGPDETGFARNHNTGIVTDEYGHLLVGETLTVFYTRSLAGANYLWSYRIYNYTVEKK